MLTLIQSSISVILIEVESRLYVDRERHSFCGKFYGRSTTEGQMAVRVLEVTGERKPAVSIDFLCET